jgi:hypothetical protein
MKRILFFFGIAVLCAACTSAKPKNPDMVADADPIALGTVSVGFDKFMSSAVGAKDVSAVFDPRTDTVYLQFTYETLTIRQFWDNQNRRKFTAALEQYARDFENRKLTEKNSKTRTAYGSTTGKTEWGQFSFTINSRSYPKMELGYQFKGKSPYFTVVQREAPDTISGDEDRNSLRITSYFTKAQAAELAGIFDQEYLLGRLEAEGISLAEKETTEADVY